MGAFYFLSQGFSLRSFCQTKCRRRWHTWGCRVARQKQLITVFAAAKPPGARSWRRTPVDRRATTMRRWRASQVPSPATSLSEREVLFDTRRAYTPSLTQCSTQTKIGGSTEPPIFFYFLTKSLEISRFRDKHNGLVLPCFRG